MTIIFYNEFMKLLLAVSGDCTPIYKYIANKLYLINVYMI